MMRCSVKATSQMKAKEANEKFKQLMRQTAAGRSAAAKALTK